MILRALYRSKGKIPPTVSLRSSALGPLSWAAHPNTQHPHKPYVLYAERESQITRKFSPTVFKTVNTF